MLVRNHGMDLAPKLILWPLKNELILGGIAGNIAIFSVFNFKNFDSISFKKSIQKRLPRGSSQVSGKLKLFKKITLKNA